MLYCRSRPSDRVRKARGGEIARGYLGDHLDEVTSLLNGPPVGLLLDLDGTISEMVPDPAGSSVSQAARSAVEGLWLKLALVAIVTGRAALQARDIVGLQDLTYVGNHGLERLEKGLLVVAEEAGPFLPMLKGLLERLKERFPSGDLLFEDKGGSFAVHYRLTDDPDKSQRDLLDAVQEMAGDQVKVVLGKTVINVLPPVELDKGTAAVSLVKEHRLSGAILIGDDVTDIDLFQAGNRLSGLGGFTSLCIAVVGEGSPSELEEEADFTLESVGEVEDFLTWMVRQTD